MYLKNLPKEYKLVLRSIKRKCKLTKTKLRFCVGPIVNGGSGDSDGYFVKGEIAIAFGNKLPHQWMKTLLHESCHLDQENEFNRMVINARESAAYEIVDSFLKGSTRYTERLVDSAFKCVMDCEMDAEKRTVKKILKWKLNELPDLLYRIDLNKYIQQANSYVNAYQLMREGVDWDTAVQVMQDAYSIMPTDDIYEIEIHPQLRRFLNKRIAAEKKSVNTGLLAVTL
jgi:hypothetical protein